MFPFPFSFVAPASSGVIPEFIIKVKTDNTGTSNNDQFTIPTSGSGYNYTVDWGDGQSDTGQTGNITHTYAAAGTYEIKIGGDFPRIYFNSTGDDKKLLEIMNWGTYQWTSMQGAFYDCSNMTITATDTADFSQVTGNLGFYHAFRGCSSMTSIPNAGGWFSGQAANPQAMFYGCSGLTTIDVANWDMSNVTDMNQMFRNCYNITSLDVSNWDVSSVTGQGFRATFGDLNSVTALDVSSWDISNATSLQETFEDCRELTTLDVSSWDMSGVFSILEMFRDCSKLTNLDLSSWDISSVTNMQSTFLNCNQLTTLGDVSGWDTSSLTNLAFTFYNTDKLTMNVTNWDTSSVTSMNQTFPGTNGTGSITGYNNWDTSAVTTFRDVMFNTGISNLATFPSSWDLRAGSGTFGIYRMFRNAGCVTGSINCSSMQWDSSSTSMFSWMYGCTGLTDITFGSNNDFSGITNMQYMFYAINGLTAVNWDSGLDLSALTSATSMITGTGTMGTSNYNTFLIALDAGSGTPGTLNAGASTYTAGPSAAASAHASLNTKGWTITDGGAV
tara:strand:- start:313 stop:1983 length:1671 start_codon:yes stop_codon:yes gene_type:complete